MALDPVCGMTVEPERAAGRVEHEGTTYYFCSKGCVAKFTADPKKYLSGTREPMRHAPAPLLTIGGLKRANAPAPPAAAPEPAASAIDPVCGMTVDPARAAGHVDHAGQTYHFCSKGCVAKFTADPDKYLSTNTNTNSNSNQPSEVSNVQSAEWVCPMDPEVVSDKPGACPKCGMALEPRVASASDAPNPELVDMTRRFWIGVVLGAPVFVLSMGDMVTGGALGHRLGAGLVNWIGLALAAPVVFWCGQPFFERMWQSFVNRSPNMFTLIGLGVGSAFLYSAVATVAPGLFPDGFRMHGAVDTYFDTTVVITVLVLLGQVLELRARHRTGAAIRQLLGLAPKTARLVRGDREEDVPLEQVRPGDIVRVRPGDKVPVDGVVVDGGAAVDESMVTGESMPVAKRAGDSVIGSTIASDGTFTMRAQRVGSETLLAQIVRMVGDAQRTRAPIQRLADRFASYFVPAVVLTSIATFVAWSLVGPEPRFAHALVNAVAVLIIACPCALGLATPMAIMVGTGRGARAGVLIKNAEALELLARVDTLVVDKTGTVTDGRPRVTAVDAADGWKADDVLRLAAAVERGSRHPLASAIGAEAATRGLAIPPLVDFQSAAGMGVSGRVEGRQVNLGNVELMRTRAIDLGRLGDRADARRREGDTVLFVAVDGAPVGFVAAADPVRPFAAPAIQALRAEGVHVIMLTGDNRVTAEAVARQLGIDDVRAEVLPRDKRSAIADLQRAGRLVAMAGDGINDAPALAQATVGIAMGTGTDVAIESAGITLIKGDLRGIVRARRLSRATIGNIRQNLFLAFIYNTLGVPIAAGVLYPFFGLLITPIWASAAMTLSSLSVIANALRLHKLDL